VISRKSSAATTTSKICSQQRQRTPRRAPVFDARGRESQSSGRRTCGGHWQKTVGSRAENLQSIPRCRRAAPPSL
jgi:hypothetical protein